MSQELDEQEAMVPAVIRELPARRSSVLLMPVMDVNTAMVRLREFQAFCDSYLEEGIDGDYGVIPGTKKKTLLKPGADKLCEVYGLYDEYELISKVEDWDKGLFDYTFACRLRTRADDSLAGTGVGSCSSYESKYRWREQKRKCPQCGLEGIIKGKEQYGGGWLCWKKTGGCGTTFKDKDQSIEGQVIGRVENPDIIDAKNTVLKMAKKRAKIDAVIGVTRSSGIFTQDFGEDEKTTTVQPEVVAESKTFTRPKGEWTQDLGGPVPEKQPTSSAGSIKGAAAVEAKPQPAATPADADKALVDALSKRMAPSPDATIDTPRQKRLHRAFKDAIPGGAAESTVKAADTIFREWLKHEGYVGPDGLGSTKGIPMLLFDEVQAKAEKFAGTLR